MGPYMRPMALNVPVTMLMSMVVAFTITPWLAYHLLKREVQRPAAPAGTPTTIRTTSRPSSNRGSTRLFYPLMAPLLHSRLVAWTFLRRHGAADRRRDGPGGACGSVPLKMLPFDNKNELLLVLDFDEGTTLERTDAAVREFEALPGRRARGDRLHQLRRAGRRRWTSTAWCGTTTCARATHVAEIRVNLVARRTAQQQSHAIGLRMRDDLTGDRRPAPGAAEARRDAARPAGASPASWPKSTASPTIATRTCWRPPTRSRAAWRVEPGVVDVDDMRRGGRSRSCVFVTDQEKAALERRHHRADRRHAADRCWPAATVGLMQEPTRSAIRCGSSCACREPSGPAPRTWRGLQVKGSTGQLVPLAELGRWEDAPRRPDDLPQEPAARGLRVRRDGRPAAGRRGGGYPGRPRRNAVADRATDPSASATAGCRAATPRPSPGARSSPTAAASPGACPSGIHASTSPAKASGRSRSMSSATWAWPSARR